MHVTEDDRRHMRRAIELALESIQKNDGGPFGCVIVKDGEIIGEGRNMVTSSNDPTAHAEVVAIRNACAKLGSFQLAGCVLYTSCEPCPMCLGAIYWARPERIFIACRREDAAEHGFDDAFIYDEIELDAEQRRIPAVWLMREEALAGFREWDANAKKIEY